MAYDATRNRVIEECAAFSMCCVFSAMTTRVSAIRF
jgi:hypothetical protein